MTSQAHFVQPPRFALWLLNLFAPTEQAESILGDLLEEYSQLASKSGVGSARRWYRRQAVKTIVHLVGSGFRIAPWSTTAGVVGWFLLFRFVRHLPENAIFAVLHKSRVYDHHFHTYVLFATDGITAGYLIAAMLVGCMVAFTNKGTEIVATTRLVLALIAMDATAVLVWIATGRDALLWTLPWYFADSLALFIGAAIVRTVRSAPPTLSSTT